MLSKESKIRVLENFYALDYVFFGKSVRHVESCCPLVKEEYLSIKGALLSVFVEMLKLVDHTPAVIEEKIESKKLLQSARETAKIARENAQKIVSTNKSRANIKENLKAKIKEDKDIDISAVIESQIRQKAFSLAVDNLLLARVVSEATSFDKLNEWEGTIIEDSYKILRDNLIESAYELLYEEDEDIPEEGEEDEKKVAEQVLDEGFFGTANIKKDAGKVMMSQYKGCMMSTKNSGEDKKLRDLKCTQVAAKAVIAALKSGMSKCKDDKCRASITQAINNHQIGMKKRIVNIQNMQKKK